MQLPRRRDRTSPLVRRSLQCLLHYRNGGNARELRKAYLLEMNVNPNLTCYFTRYCLRETSDSCGSNCK